MKRTNKAKASKPGRKSVAVYQVPSDLIPKINKPQKKEINKIVEPVKPSTPGL